MAKEREYEKLPGRGQRGGRFFLVTRTVSRLWLAKDHLLLVDGNGFAESYKRFAFRDIQAIALTQTWRRTFLNVALGVVLAIFAVLAAVVGDAGQGLQIFFGVIAALFAVLIAINSLKGPTCRCYLTTAVQTDEIASLRRVGRARKVLERIRPLIAAAQSSPTVENTAE